MTKHGKAELIKESMEEANYKFRVVQVFKLDLLRMMKFEFEQNKTLRMQR